MMIYRVSKYHRGLNALACKIIQEEPLKCEEERLFISNFGVAPEIYLRVLDEIQFGRKTTFEHVLWGLHFLYDYGKEGPRLAAAGIKCRKTLRKHVWKVVRRIARHMPKVVSDSTKKAFSINLPFSQKV